MSGSQRYLEGRKAGSAVSSADVEDGEQPSVAAKNACTALRAVVSTVT